MKTASIWSVLAVWCVACGSAFQAAESGNGGSGPGGSASGGDAANAGSTSNGGTGTDGGNAGSGSAGRHNHAGSGGVGVGGDGVSVGGDVSIGGSVGVSGGSPGGGASGSDSAGTGGVVSSAGSGGSDTGGTGGSDAGGTAGSGGSTASAGTGGTSSNCDAMWANYLNLRENATVCQLVAKGDCSGTVLPDECGCNIPVSNSNADTAKAKEALKAIQDQKCPGQTCFAPCKGVANPTCTLGGSPDTAATCQSANVPTQ